MAERDRRLYDSISSTYTTTRRPDPRITARIAAALGNAGRVVNIGAGTGNYEPADRPVVAVEPSAAMLAGRGTQAAPAVQAVAERLPFTDGSFDVAMATLTLHHWRELLVGLQEMRRVAERQVILLFDPGRISLFWAMQYWPQALRLPSEIDAPGPEKVAEALDVREVRTVPIPNDCTDGFGAAFWGRPEAYLHPEIQAGMSWLAQLPAPVLAEGADLLRRDLRSGAWDDRYGHLRRLPELDVGYRLILAGGPTRPI